MKIYTNLIFLTLFTCQNPIARFAIEAGDIDRSFSPIYIEVNLVLDPDKSYFFEEANNGKTHPAQFMEGSSLITFVDSFPAGTRKVLELKEGIQTNRDFSKVTLEQQNEGIQILVSGKPLLFYQKETAFPEGSHPDYYKRSGFIHSLQSPEGSILTDDFPKGHIHQNGIFYAWTNTTYKGKKVDFWNRQEELGTVEHKKVINTREGLLAGQIITKLSHISLTDGELLEEVWHLTVFPFSDFFLFDLGSEQINTSQDTLFLEEYLYGGMAYRGSKEWNRDDPENFTNPWKILTSEGFTNQNANHTKARWVHASGTIEGKEAGVAVFGFPDNFRAPQTIRVHPEMPYWVYSPVVEGPFYIAPGEKYISRYRYYIHDGKADIELMDIMSDNIEKPVTVVRLD